MTTFTQAIHATHKATPTTTENGMPARLSTSNYCLDYFYDVGTYRTQSPDTQLQAFYRAHAENPDLAIRILLWSRDIRQGSGQRRHFRIVLTNLANTNPPLAERITNRIAELGRWDDLLTLFSTPVELHAKQLITNALNSGDALCAKWMPREKSTNRSIAYRVRKHMGLTPKQYRKLLATLSTTVEQQMCANQWSDITYSHVPSQASRIYSKAFSRHDELRYSTFLADALNPDSTEKVNAGAIYPYDVLKGVRSTVDTQRILAQWQSLPNFLPSDARILPMIDVSASMDCSAGGSSITCMDVAVSLGLYIAEKQVGPFKDTYLTFHNNPTLNHATGDVVTKARSIYQADWGGSTNIEAAFHKVFFMAAAHKVPASEMPTHILIFSDMQFNEAVNHPNTKVMKLVETICAEHGYTIPRIVFWNLHETGNVPTKSTRTDVAMVSGFSPSLVKSVLDNIDNYNPETVMLNTVSIDRYNY
jgi:hypothetical protein